MRRADAAVLPLVTSGTAGVLSLLTVVVVARSTDPAGYAEFAVVWACFFGIGGSLSGLQQEVTRSKIDAVRAGAAVRVSSRVLPVLVVVALAGGLTAWFLTGRVVVGVAVLVGLSGLTVMTSVSGVLAAEGRWRDLSAVLILDALGRTAAVCVVAAFLSAELVAPAVVAGAVLWTVGLVRPPARRALAATTTQPAPAFYERCASGMASAGCAALLVAGYPMLVAALSDDVGSSGDLLAALVLVRSPLLMVVFAYRPVLLQRVLGRRDRARATAAALGAVAVAALPVLLAALVLGPPLVRLLAGGAYVVSRTEAVALAASGLLLAALVVSGVGLVAVDRHRMSTAGWVVAIGATAAAVVAAPAGRGELLFPALVGPAAGLVVHAWALATSRARPGPARSGPTQSSPSENADSRSWRE